MALEFIKTNSEQNASSEIISEFIHLAHSVVHILQQYGLDIRPYRSLENLAFAKLPAEIQVKYLGHFRNYAEVMAETHGAGHDLRESKFLIWNMLNRLGYRAVDDVISKVTDNQIVEIYNAENIQVFRNLPFFKVCSYSIDEILSLPWWELYKRDDQISQKIFQYASQVLNGEIETTVQPDIPVHYLEEKDSFNCHKMDIVVKLMSPLVSQSSGNAILVTEEATLHRVEPSN